MCVNSEKRMSVDEAVSGGLLRTEDEAAAFLKLSNRTLQAWRVRGCGPKFRKLGRSVRYRLEDVQAFVNENVHQSTSKFMMVVFPSMFC